MKKNHITCELNLRLFVIHVKNNFIPTRSEFNEKLVDSSFLNFNNNHPEYNVNFSTDQWPMILSV